MQRTVLSAGCVIAIVLVMTPLARAQLDTISQFYMPDRFCAWDANGPGGGAWMCSGPPVGPGFKRKPPVFGAISIAPNLNWWTTTKFASEGEARRVANDACNKANGGGCKTATVVADNCAALAISPRDKLYKVVVSGAINWAEENAVNACRKAGGHECKVTTSICADSKRHEQTCETRFFNGNPVCVEPDGRGKPFGRGG
jgi:hypothetical protein